MIIPVLVVVFRKKLGFDGSLCHFIAVIGMSSIAPYSANICGSENLFLFVTGCAIMFIGSGLLGVWNFRWSLNFALIFLTSLTIGHFIIGLHDFFTFIFYLIGPIALSAFIGLMILRSRMKIMEREFIMKKILEKSQDDMRKNKDKIKSELDFLIYSISHDLRSPILSVKGLLLLIKDYEKLNSENKEYLSLAENSVDRLDQSIYDMLDYADNAGFDSPKEKFDIIELVKEIFDDLRFLSKQEVDFQIKFEGNSQVYSDKKRIKTIIKNLASNAVKYGRKDGVQPIVSFSMKQFANHVEFQLADNGPGIPEMEQQKIFEMFYRISNESGGLGLGLFIVKEALVKLGGSIQLKSSVQKGSVFSVRIPVEKIKGKRNKSTVLSFGLMP